MIYNIYLIYLNLILNYSYRLVDVWLLGWAGVGGAIMGWASKLNSLTSTSL